jgi:hypothetical protein
MLDAASIALLRSVEESAMDAVCTFTNKAGAIVGPELPCSVDRTERTPQELGLGDRTTTGQLFDVRIPATSAILFTAPNLFATYRASVVFPDARTLLLHVRKYDGPISNESAGLIICEHVG